MRFSAAENHLGHRKWIALTTSCLVNFSILAILFMASFSKRTLVDSVVQEHVEVQIVLLDARPPLIGSSESGRSVLRQENQTNDLKDSSPKSKQVGPEKDPTSKDQSDEEDTMAKTDALPSSDGKETDALNPQEGGASISADAIAEEPIEASVALRRIQCATTGLNRPAYCNDTATWEQSETQEELFPNIWSSFEDEETFLESQAGKLRARGCLNNGAGFAASEGPIVTGTEDFLTGPGRTIGTPAKKKKNRFFCD